MEIAEYLIEAANQLLEYEGDSSLPRKLAESEFYLAKANDSSIFAFGVIKFRDIEYKIGTQKTQ